MNGKLIEGGEESDKEIEMIYNTLMRCRRIKLSEYK
jgi:hypothetical protein